jgi:putative transposase
MILSEKHIIKKTHKYYDEIDNLCFLSKNLYNRANYVIRQEFIGSSKKKELGLVDRANYLNYYDINRKLIDEKDVDFYRLPAKVANQTLMILDKNWKSFFKSIKDWKQNPDKYTGRPKLPKYKDKTKGRFVLVYELGAICKPKLKHNVIKLSKTNIEIPFIKKSKDKSVILKCVRLVPNKNNSYKIEIIYEKKEENLNLNKNNVISIDLGVNNLMTLTSNRKDIKPILINGRPLKSINQYYNKKLSEYNSELPVISEKQLRISKKIKKLTFKRNQKVNNYLHWASKYLIEFCMLHDVGTIIIGLNKQWKTEVDMRKDSNQNFVQIPHTRFIEMIKYKCGLKGIDVQLQEESYTSKASFLNLDYIPTYKKGDDINHIFSGYRKHRGLYKVKKSKEVINADVNGSYNILRKAIPNVFANGIEGFAVNPIRVTSNKHKINFNIL